MRRTRLQPLTFLFGLVFLAACPTVAPEPDEGNAATPEAYETRPRAAAVPTRPDDRSPQWIVQKAGGETNDRHTIDDFAVAGGYVYFMVQWAGVYRSPLAGGPVEVVDTGRGRSFAHLAASKNDVYWASARFDDRHNPVLRVRHLAAPNGKPVTLLDHRQLGTFESNLEHFRASEAGVFLVAGPNGPGPGFHILRISPADRTVKQLISIGNALDAPAWVVDASHLYYAPSGLFYLGPPDLFVHRVGVDGGAPEDLVARPNMNLAPLAVDATHVYLASERAIYTLDKATKALAKLAETPHFVQGPCLVVDDANLYFVESPVEGRVKIYAVAKRGGTPAVIGEITEKGQLQVDRFTQDTTHLYFEREGRISVLPKPAPPAPEAVP